MTAEKIKFVDYVIDRILKGDEITASGDCSYTKPGIVYTTCYYTTCYQKNGIEDRFLLKISKKWFGFSEKITLIRGGEFEIELTDKNKEDLKAAWQLAAIRSKERYEKFKQEHEQKKEQLLQEAQWYP